MSDTPTPSIKDRIRQLMEKAEMNQKDFAIITGITAPTLSSIFNGRTSVTMNHIMALHKEFPNISMQWLMFGEGNMDIDATDTQTENTSGSPLSISHTTNSVSEGQQLNFLAEGIPSSASSSSMPNGIVGAMALGTPNNESLNMALEQLKKVKNISTTQRKVTEIRIFYDDGTYEVFGPKD